MSAIAASSDSTSSTAAPPVAISTTNISEICSTQPITPVTTMVYSTSLGPPPLIAADIYSVDSQHRLSTLFVPRSVYDLPINTQQQVPKLINQCIYCVYPKIFVWFSTLCTPAQLSNSSVAITVKLCNSSITTNVTISVSSAISRISDFFSTSHLPKLSLPTFSGVLLANILGLILCGHTYQPQLGWNPEV